MIILERISPTAENFIKVRFPDGTTATFFGFELENRPDH
jgi:hypothetical protein